MRDPFLEGELAGKREALEALCRGYGVSRLDLFGSGASESWRSADSDLDFVVTFHADLSRSLADRYLGLAEDLEVLFGRPVDLITDSAIRNPYFRRSVEATRVLVYAE